MLDAEHVTLVKIEAGGEEYQHYAVLAMWFSAYLSLFLLGAMSDGDLSPLPLECLLGHLVHQALRSRYCAPHLQPPQTRCTVRISSHARADGS